MLIFVVGFHKISLRDLCLKNACRHRYMLYVNTKHTVCMIQYDLVHLLCLSLSLPPPPLSLSLCDWRIQCVLTSLLHWSVNKYYIVIDLFSGNTPETKGTAFVVYEDIFDAKNACDHLSGFNVCNRYLVVLYYQSTRVSLIIYDTRPFAVWSDWQKMFL